MKRQRAAGGRFAGIFGFTGLILCAGFGSAARQSMAQTNGKTDLLALPEDRPIRGMSYPCLSPDGKTICFTYLGSLWTVPAGGGRAVRLTIHEGLDAMPRWSPDGRFIAFSSLRNGNTDIFLIPAEGGEAKQVTYNSSSDWVCDWSPDGTQLLFYSVRDTHSFALYTMDLHDRSVKRITNDDAALRFASWSPDGKSIVYTRGGQPWWRAWYRGSIAAQTVTEDITTGKVKTLFKSEAQQFWPLYSSDGKSIFVTTIGAGDNTPNIFRAGLDGGKMQAVTKHSGDAVRFPQMARNGSLMVYLYNGDLYTARPDGSDDRKVRVIARTDEQVNNQEFITLKSEATESVLSPDGKTLALALRGDIWTVSISGGDAKRLTEDHANDSDISWSPDSAKIVYVSDKGNQPDIYTMDVKTKATTRLTNDAPTESNPTYSPDGKTISYARAGSQPGIYLVSATGGDSRRLAEGNGNNNFGIGITAHSWSPDSKWLAFARMDRFENTDIWVVPAVGGAATNVTRYPGDNEAPQFSKDGRKLLFVSDRQGPPLLYQLPLEQPDDSAASDDADKKTPKPDRSKDVKIDFTDIHLRAALTAVASVADYAITPDSARAVVATGGGFIVINLANGQIQPLNPNENGGGIQFLPDGSRFYYLGAGGTPRSIAAGGGPASVVAFSAPMLFDRKALYLQAFNEFYRRFGEAFYDASMHGVDWKALRAKYEPYLAGVGTPEEFANLLSEMVGEVNSSHSEIGPATKPSGPQTASLGLTYDPNYAGPGLKVLEVMRKGPADKPSSRVLPGEYVLSVDGTDVRANEEFYLTLMDKAGKTTELLVNSKPTKDGARTVKVKPISADEWHNLEYEQRVARNREMVDKLSGGRLAYIHIRGMDGPSLVKFEREIGEDALNKEGLVLDIRGNGGGNTHDAILDVLSRKVYGYKQPRDGFRISQPDRAYTKPITLLIDNNSYSDAEIFPAGFRALKLGPIIGVPTPGYVIGTYSGRLADGTTFRLPSWGYYTADGKNMENLGIPPDIYVENTAEDFAAGRDRQIETAVATLLKDLPNKPSMAFGPDGTGVPISANSNPNGASSAVAPPPAPKPSRDKRASTAPK